MNDRKQTPDLLGDILAERQDDGVEDNELYDTATVLETSNRFSVSRQTIRAWAIEFARHLSAGANPGKGEIRAFTQDDMSVLATIARLRSDKVSYKEIHTALNTTTPAEPIASGGGEGDLAQDLIGELPSELSSESGGITQDLTRQYEERIEGLEEERDQLLDQVMALNKQLESMEGQFAEAQTAQPLLEERTVTAEDLESGQLLEEEPPSAPDSVVTLEDQLRQLANGDHWWQLWKKK